MCPIFAKAGNQCKTGTIWSYFVPKSLSHDILTEGLRRLKPGGSWAADGIPDEIFKVIPDVMLSHTFSCIKTSLDYGSTTEGIVMMLPKSFDELPGRDLQPTALQTSGQKWVTNMPIKRYCSTVHPAGTNSVYQK